MRADHAGTLTASATVSANQPDPNAANNTAAASAVATTPPSGPTMKPPQRFGFHAQPTLYVLTFNQALDSARATDVANYTIRHWLRGSHGGSAVGAPLRIASATYNAANHSVVLRMARPVPWRATYQLVVRGSGAHGVASTQGMPLEAKSTSPQGSDITVIFGPDTLAGPASLIDPNVRVGSSRQQSIAKPRA
jgi:hypothetical protein